MCELNYSCSVLPRESFYDINFYEATKLTTNVLEFVNDPGVLQELNIVLKFFNSLTSQRRKAAEITSIFSAISKFNNS
jgi:hypothetical protein